MNEASRRRTPPKGTRSHTALAAAMLAVGEILEPEKTEVSVEQDADEPTNLDNLAIHFEGLPPLPGLN